MVVVAKVKSSTPLKDIRKIIKSDDSGEVKPGKSRSSRGKSEQKKKSKSRKAGEVDLEKWRNDEMLNELAKKHLAEFYKKGKLQRSIKHLPKHAHLQVELSSSDSDYSTSDISVKCKSNKSKKGKVLKYSR